MRGPVRCRVAVAALPQGWHGARRNRWWVCAISLAFAVPVAVFDVPKITGLLGVRYAADDENYLPFAGQVEHPDVDEVILTDEARNAHAGGNSSTTVNCAADLGPICHPGHCRICLHLQPHGRRQDRAAQTIRA